MKFNPISRRFFLKGLGGSILTLPFLESMVPKAYAAVAPPNALRRFICIGHANGSYRPDWYPPDSNLARMIQVGATHREMRLTDVAGPVANTVSHLIGPEFSGVRSKMLLLKNLHSLFPSLNGHQMSTVLAGSMGRGGPIFAVQPNPKYFGPSIDQVMALSNKIYPSNPIIRALHLRTSILESEPEIELSWDFRNGKMEFPTRFTQPLTAFNAVFNITSAPPVGSKDNLLVDQVIEQYRALKNNARATASDKAILDDHMAMIAQLQTTVQTMPMTCSAVAPTKTYNKDSVAERGPMIDAYTQLLVAAIKCGATRIATLCLSRGVDDLNFDSVLGTTAGTGWHDLGHSFVGESSLNMRKIHQWHMQKSANVINQLNVAEPGTNGTYLDNCIVYVGFEQATHAHDYRDRPILIAGSGGGMLQTNKYIDYSPSPAASQDYNRMLVTFMQSMGLSQADYYTANMQALGVKPGFGDDQGSNGDRANPLPGMQVGG